MSESFADQNKKDTCKNWAIMQKDVSLKLKLPKIDSDVNNNNDTFNLKKDLRSPIFHKQLEVERNSLSFPAIGDEIQRRNLTNSAKRHSYVSQHRSDSGFQEEQHNSKGRFHHANREQQQTSKEEEVARKLLDEKDTKSKDQTLFGARVFHNSVTSHVTTGFLDKNDKTDARNNSVRQKLLQFQEKRVKHSNFYEKIEESRAKKYRHRLQRQEAFDIHTAVEMGSLKKCNDWLNAWFTKEGMPREMSPDPPTDRT